MKEYIAFDIGGTHIKYGIVSETGTVLKHKTVQQKFIWAENKSFKNSFFYQKINGEHKVWGMVLVRQELLTLIKVVTGGVDHIPGYSMIPIMNRLQAVLKVPVSIDNDVNCAAFGEKWNGSGREERKLYYAHPWNWYWRSNFL